MRMGRVLALVAGALVFFIAALGLAVYFTRDEDNLQADNLLAENFTKAVTLAPQNDDRVVLPDLARFEWDRVLLVQPGTPRAEISRAAGPRVDRDRHRRRRRPAALPARRGGRAVRRLPGFEHVRRASSGRSRRSPREHATFAVRDRVIRPGPPASACGAPCARPSGRASSCAPGPWPASCACAGRPRAGAGRRTRARGIAPRASRRMNQPITPKPMISAPPMMKRTLRPVEPSSTVGDLRRSVSASRRSPGGSGPKAPDCAPAAAGRARTSSGGDEGDATRHGPGQGSHAGAPVNAQRDPANRMPHVTRRMAISATRPHHTPRMPQSLCSVSSTIGM